jgi:hypothetical protein
MSALRFHPTMSLADAAKLAHGRGMELRVVWEGNECVVEPVRIQSDDFVPAFLRLQAGPLCDEESEKVVKLRHLGA